MTVVTNYFTMYVTLLTAKKQQHTHAKHVKINLLVQLVHSYQRNDWRLGFPSGLTETIKSVYAKTLGGRPIVQQIFIFMEK